MARYRRIGASCRVIPPIGGGVAAKLQTHWANNADNGLFWRNGSALWRNWWALVRWLIDALLQGRVHVRT